MLYISNTAALTLKSVITEQIVGLRDLICDINLKPFHILLTLPVKDTPFYNETDSTIYWTGTWNYEQIWLEDHYALPVYKTSRLLDKITKLQVTSPELNGREAEIPISPDSELHLNLASDYLMV